MRKPVSLFLFFAVLFLGLSITKPEAFAQGKPTVVSPKIIKDIKIEIPKNNKFWLGDWNSSGAPEPPYLPGYDYSYTCQAQLTDGLIRNDKDGSASYRFYAIANLNLKNNVSSIRSEDLQWTAQKFFNGASVLDTNEPIPFSTEGNFFGIYLRPGGGQELDEVHFFASLVQKEGPLKISAYNKKSILRNDSTMELYVETNVRHDENPHQPSMQLRVLCYKEL